MVKCNLLAEALLALPAGSLRTRSGLALTPSTETVHRVPPSISESPSPLAFRLNKEEADVH
ncbi:hypothetical protein DSO57_1038766 [Entomophthora muscae]|uniref:Uncharacterized protein n=1 Tax=Entomophthora muscae TaxID=34485 RepID=A0ACC2RPI4_9FUNG|nr:hypothetical protein DSO57_1038766 [Entomophthora muscae]